MKKRFHVVLLVLLLLAVVSMFAMEIQADDGPKDPVVDPTEITEEAPSVSYAYDPAAEGILSTYYYVDQARGFLLGIAAVVAYDRLAAKKQETVYTITGFAA